MLDRYRPEALARKCAPARFSARSMRRWLIAVGVGVALFGGVLGVAMAGLGRWVDTHREWLAARAESVIGRPVRFGAASVSLLGGLGVRVTDVRIPDDPTYGEGDLLHADEVWVTVRLLPALT